MTKVAFPAAEKWDKPAGAAALHAPGPTGPTGATTPTSYRFDPRPDLADDHRLWMAVLGAAWIMDERAVKNPGDQSSEGDGAFAFYGLLHGLRCGGARLEVRTHNGRGFLKLDYTPLLVPDGRWQAGELRSVWLEPYKEHMRTAFGMALRAHDATQAPAVGAVIRPRAR